MAIRTVGPIRDYTTVQAAINAAAGGDIIQCDAGRLFSEWLTLPNKGVLTQDILITTSATPAQLPPAGVRTDPSYAAFMPTIQSPGSGLTTVQVAPGANHYKFQHVHFPEVPGGFNAIISIGKAGLPQEFYADEPHHITVDQCYIHGGIVCGQKLGVQCNGRYIWVTNNYFNDIKSVGQDCGSITGLNGHGPLVVINNRLCGGTEPFILGGGDPSVRTFMTITGGASSTGANVTCFDPGHTLSELLIGQGISVSVAGVYTFATIATITGTGASGSITFSSVGGTPDAASLIKTGVILGMEGPGFGLTFQRNWVLNDPSWANGVLQPVSGVVATPQTGLGGTLPAQTHYYTVQGFSTGGYQGLTVSGAESVQVAAILTATGRVSLSWTAIPGATSYRIWHADISGTRNKYATSTSNSYIDDGTAMTAATPGGATFHQIKNIFELKAVQNAQIDSNIFEYAWRGNGNGWALWFKSVNQNGDAPYLQTKNIVFEKNIVRHCYGFMEVHGRERGSSAYPWAAPVTNLMIRNNLLYDSGGVWAQGGSQYDMNCLEGITNMTIDHNTLIHVGSGSMVVDATQLTPMLGLVITNNMMRKESFGIKSGGFASGTASLNAVTSGGYTFDHNAIADSNSGIDGAGNFYESAALWQAEFVNYVFDGSAGADFHIKPGSAYHNAGLDGKDIGCDVDLVLAATANVTTSGSGGSQFAAQAGMLVAASGTLAALPPAVDQRVQLAHPGNRVYAR